MVSNQVWLQVQYVAFVLIPEKGIPLSKFTANALVGSIRLEIKNIISVKNRNRVCIFI